MTDFVYELIFMFGWASMWAIRFPFIRQSLKTEGTEYPSLGRDKLLVGILLLGTTVIPLLYIFTPWLDFADYTLPPLVSMFCVSILILALVILRRAHVDLGRSYSQDLEIKEGHKLVTRGIYQYIRHPMYAAGFIMSISQIGLLQNWIAGISGVIVLIPFYMLRVPIEEEMMLENFGKDYESYINRINRLLPFL